MSLLNEINMPNDLRQLPMQKLPALADEVRAFLVENVAKTGGHLASNLGVVELTIALHYVFNTPRDKLVWDVGHQCYTHKILTGRRGRFGSLRKLDGISGFVRPSESEYDAFVSGHSSNSLSAAQGIAIAADLGGNGVANTVAIIGDGALTGGPAFEGLNNIGHWGGRLIVVLNDNEMSITKNVGSYSRYLNKLRTSAPYVRFKHETEALVTRVPVVGKSLARGLYSIKEALKHVFLPTKLFEELGFIYYGPTDGHNIFELCHALELAKKCEKPVIVHVLTKKGKGLAYAEDNPEAYHGVGKFNPQNGEPDQETPGGYSEHFGSCLLKLAHNNHKIVAISPAMPNQCGLRDFSCVYPDRFFDVGIAEAHAVIMAAGLSSLGRIPVVCAYSSFFQRAYDQIIHDAAIGNYHVVLAVDRAGLVGADGETHQGVFDLPFFNSIPNTTVLAPSCRDEMEQMLSYCVEATSGVFVLRYPRTAVSLRHCTPFAPGKLEVVREGEDCCLITFGRLLDNAIEAAEALSRRGVSAAVVNLRTLKPLDVEGIRNIISRVRLTITLEDNMLAGGVGSEILLKTKILPMVNLGFETFVKQGSLQQLDQLHGLSAEKIVERALSELGD